MSQGETMIGILIITGIVGGAIIFGLYFLLYIVAIQHSKEKVIDKSLVARLPLIVGIINSTISIILFAIILLPILISFFGKMFAMPEEFFNTARTIFSTGLSSFHTFPVFLICLFLPIPLSLGSIAISFLQMKKNYMTKKIFLRIFLLNAICIIIVIAIPCIVG